MKKAGLFSVLLAALVMLPATTWATVTVPTETPFSYNVGFNYDPWGQAWNAYSQEQYVAYVTKDLDAVTQGVHMIHTYHGAGVGTGALVIDDGQYAIMQYAAKNPGKNIELFLCTNQDAPTAAKLGDADYAVNWVKTILLAPLENNISLVKKVVKAIGIGNEVDAQSVFTSAQMDTAIKNLTTALKAEGLQDIPITTSIANIANNPVAKGFVDVVSADWQSSWGTAFVFANNYPWMQSGDINTLEGWYQGVQKEYSNLNIFIGETGYPSVSDPSSEFDKKFPKVSGGTGEFDYITGLFAWLDTQYVATKGHTVPTFIFSATDMPKKYPAAVDCSENHYGLYTTDLKLKTDTKGRTISIPNWLTETH